MIKINLLPSEAAKRAGPTRARTMRLPRGGLLPWILALVLLHGGILYSGYAVYKKSQDSTDSVAQTKLQKARKEREVKRREEQFQQDNQHAQEIEEKYQVVQALTQNRIFWSEKLNMIGRARMDLAVYVTKIVLDEKIDEQETPESIKRREEWKKQTKHPPGQEREPRAVKRPVINQTLTIHAIAYGNDSAQRLQQVNAFQETLRTLTWDRKSNKTVRFLDGLAPEFGQLQQKMATVAGVEVLRFGLVCKANPQLDRTSEIQKPSVPGGATATPAPGGKK